MDTKRSLVNQHWHGQGSLFSCLLDPSLAMFVMSLIPFIVTGILPVAYVIETRRDTQTREISRSHWMCLGMGYDWSLLYDIRPYVSEWLYCHLRLLLPFHPEGVACH